MDEFSRPATLEDLKLLLRSLYEHDADYFLIGGYALAAHGYQRATTDIDVVVPATAQAGERVKEALMGLPDGAAKDIEPSWFEEGENIRVADAFVVDLMLNANGQTYETLSQYAETIELDGIPVKTISLEGLLLTKKTMRDKDMSDRIIIERALELFKLHARGDDEGHGKGHQHLTKIHTTIVRLADAPALADFLASIPNSEGLAQLLAGRGPLNTRAFDDDSGIARFVISDGSVVTCFTVADITIDQAEMITLACEATDAWDEASFKQAVADVIGTAYE